MDKVLYIKREDLINAKKGCWDQFFITPLTEGRTCISIIALFHKQIHAF